MDATSSLAASVAGAPSALPSRGRVGMACLIATESAFFATFLVAYGFYLGRSPGGPSPRDVLDVPVVGTVCLLGSSATMAWALRALRSDRRVGFAGAWLVTLGLGATFLLGTAREWARLIGGEHFTIATNLFGTTFYALVGFHAAHVAVGLVLLAIVLALTLRGRVRAEHAERVELVGWYWHFVDAVWVFVFTLVYLVGR